MDVSVIVWNVAQRLKAGKVREAVCPLIRRAYVRVQEWRYHIRTDGEIDLSELGIHNEEFKHYGATDYVAFRRIMLALGIDPREHIFLDYGSGKGRAVILAATYQFRRVLGVEIAPELTRIAQDNVERSRRKLRCTDIEITTGNATSFQIPPGVTIFYFNNPFFGEILAAVLDNILSFANKATHPIMVVCNVPPNSMLERQMFGHPGFKIQKQFPLPAGRRCLIFVTTRTTRPPSLHCSPCA
jgi:predicted RNA methylase